MDKKIMGKLQPCEKHLKSQVYTQKLYRIRSNGLRASEGAYKPEDK